MKRRIAREHLVQENAIRPVVDREVVVVSLQDLGRDVIRRAAEGVRLAVLGDPFAHAKVADLAVALAVEKHIVQLEVTVDDSLVVQELETAQDLSCIKSGPILRELLEFDYVEHQVTSV